MLQITKIVEWDMGHRVPEHNGKCRSPHGHRYRLELTVAGDLHENAGSDHGMIMDFGEIKQAMLTVVHDRLDHAFMVWEEDDAMRAFYAGHEDEQFKYLVVPFVPTAENIASWCGRAIADELPAGVRVVRARVFETPNSWADYLPDA